MATLSPPSGVGITVAAVAIIAAAVIEDIPALLNTGYKVARRIIARLEALGITRDNTLTNTKTNGTRI